MVEKIANEILGSQIIRNETINVEKIENGVFYAGINTSRRGTGIIIIGEDYTFLYGDSSIGLSQLLEKFKNGERTNYKLECIKEEGENKMNEEFKTNKNVTYKDEETKKVYLEFLNEINEYNKKVANGENPEHDIAYFSNKYEKIFEVENNVNANLPVNDNSKEIERLLNRIDEKLGIKNDGIDTDSLIKCIDDRIAMLEKEERNDEI